MNLKWDYEDDGAENVWDADILSMAGKGWVRHPLLTLCGLLQKKPPTPPRTSLQMAKLHNWNHCANLFSSLFSRLGPKTDAAAINQIFNFLLGPSAPKKIPSWPLSTWNMCKCISRKKKCFSSSFHISFRRALYGKYLSICLSPSEKFDEI